MTGNFDIWKALAGIAFFLLGMNLLEEGLKMLTGRKFKLFLKRQSSKKLSAIASGAIATAVLQSSSVVNLMVLALTGAGIIGMQHALALMLGANLGTTLSTWFIAAVGFNLNLESLSIPIIGIAGVCRLLFRKNGLGYNWSTFLLGIGFLFIGIDFMKSGIGTMIDGFDPATLRQYPSIVFMSAGILLTALIQSSSATVAIVLSALYVNAINFHDATAIVLGTEVGTTLKILLASTKGSSVKKRVALGNFLYNCIVALLILSVLRQVNQLITDVIGIKNVLIALSFFQTFVNFAGIIIFFPLLNRYGKFLDRLFANYNGYTKFINKVPVGDADLAITALQKEAVFFLEYVIHFSKNAFVNINKRVLPNHLDKRYIDLSVPEQYDYIKELHGDIYEYCIQLQSQPLPDGVAHEIDRLLASVRNTMYAAKSMKDALQDIGQLRDSANELKYNFYLSAKEKAFAFYKQLEEMLQKDKSIYFETLLSTYKSVQEGYTTALKELYAKNNIGMLTEMEISTVINFNRELYTSFKSMTLAIKDCLLTANDAAYFDDLPGFIR